MDEKDDQAEVNTVFEAAAALNSTLGAPKSAAATSTPGRTWIGEAVDYVTRPIFNVFQPVDRVADESYAPGNKSQAAVTVDVPHVPVESAALAEVAQSTRPLKKSLRRPETVYHDISKSTRSKGTGRSGGNDPVESPKRLPKPILTDSSSTADNPSRGKLRPATAEKQTRKDAVPTGVARSTRIRNNHERSKSNADLTTEPSFASAAVSRRTRSSSKSVNQQNITDDTIGNQKQVVPNSPATALQGGSPENLNLATGKSSLQSSDLRDVEDDLPDISDMSRPPRPHTEEGISDVLQNPSPRKPIRQQERAAKSKVLNGAKRGSKQQPAANEKIPTISVCPLPSMQPTFENDRETQRNFSQDGKQVDEFRSKVDTVVKSIAKDVHRAGRDQNGEFQAEPRSSIKSVRSLVRAANRFVTVYSKLRALHGAEATDAARIERQVGRLADIQTSLQDGIQAMLDDDFDGSTEPRQEPRAEITSFLRELYLYAIPALVKTLKPTFDSAGDEQPLETTNIEHLVSLLTSLDNLILATQRTHQSLQPIPTAAYRVRDPTRRAGPKIHNLLRLCTNELAVRNRTAAQRAAVEAAPERARKRKREIEETKVLEEAELQSKIRQRQRAITASINMTRARLGMPPTGPRAHNNTINLKSTMTYPLPSRSGDNHNVARRLQAFSKTRPVDNTGGVDDDDDDLFGSSGASFRRVRGAESTTEEDRLQMFGHHNASQVSLSVAWSVEELKVLIDGLRQEHDPDRYEIIADKLDKSLDEVFAKAKEFKVAMEEEYAQRLQRSMGRSIILLEAWIRRIG